MIGIYKITNLLNDKIYIGQSADIESRWYQHKRNIQKENKLWYPIAREESTSINDFKFEVVEECEKEKLGEREKYWIEYYNATEEGYNASKGGKGYNARVKEIKQGVKIVKKKGVMTTFEKLKYLKEHGVSLRYIAKKAECSPQTLTNWINSEKPISSRMERSIREAIDMILNDFTLCK